MTDRPIDDAQPSPSPSLSASAANAEDLAAAAIQAPPRGIFPTLARIGPGLIIAGSIVGSGELIATTKTGADAGFWLLWLIIIGCVIKVFVQVELGRYTISSGETTIRAMNRVPGPRLGHRGNWVLWYWFLMFVASIAQLGGIVGGVGQALSISLPLTEAGADYDRIASLESRLQVHLTQWARWDDSQKSWSAQLSTRLPATEQVFKDMQVVAELLGKHEQSKLDKLSSSNGTESRDAGSLSTEGDLAIEQAAIQQRITELHWLEQHCETILETLAAVRDSNSSADDSTPEPNNLEPTPELAAAEKLTQQTQDLWSQLTELLRAESKLAGLEANLKEARELQSTADVTKFEQEVAELRDETTEQLERCEQLDQSIQSETGRSLIDSFRTYRQTVAALSPPIDDKIWAAIIAVITSLILMKGRFGLILSFSTAMVAGFTAMTIVNLFLLQTHEAWSVSFSDIVDGLRFRLPPGKEGDSWSALSTALKTFGIIGVGASELVAYPYWCSEQGYARFTGPRDDSEAWASRARGWIRVMWVDAWGSMLIYTFATIAFYLLGASVLGRSGVVPSEPNLIRYLTVMFTPVFGEGARLMFLFGAFAVLYSTLFVATASHARVFGDALRVLKFVPDTEKTYRVVVVVLSGLFPMICLAVYLVFPKPTFLVMLSGLMQAIMLPMLAATAIYVRMTRLDSRLRPGFLADAGLIVSSLGMLVAGLWLAWSELIKLL